MAGELILHTGGLIGLLDRSQNAHAACADFYAQWDGPVITTEPVITEATHLLSDVKDGPLFCLDFVLRRGVVLVPSSEISLRRCRRLMEKYADVPMPLADATIVVLAEELGTDLVLAVDPRLRNYRIRGRKSLTVVPAPSRKGR